MCRKGSASLRVLVVLLSSTAPRGRVDPEVRVGPVDLADHL